MAIIKSKPTSAGRRFYTKLSADKITKFERTKILEVLVEYFIKWNI